MRILVCATYYKIKNPDVIQDFNEQFGGSDEDRTRYLLHAMEALSQVSYGPTVRYLLYINSFVRQQLIDIFAKRKGDNHLSNILARLRRFERPTSSLGGKRSIQLSYKRVTNFLLFVIPVWVFRLPST